MSSGRTGTRVSGRPVAARMAERIAAVETTVGRLADALDAVGRVGLGHLDELDLDGRHVERRREQVVGEARVQDRAVAGHELLHQREPEALRGAALDLALDRERVDRLADVLRRADPDDARQAELDVDLDDDAHRGDRERDVGALAGDLPGLRVERRRARMPVDALDVDLVAPAARAPRAPRGTRHGPRPRPSTSCRDADAEPAEPTAAVVCGASDTSSVPSSVRATWRITPMTPCPTSAAAECTTALPSAPAAAHAGGAEVVEALRVADVLEAEREADAAPDALAASSCCPRRRGAAAGRAAACSSSGSGIAAARRITSRDGQRAGHDLAGRAASRPGSSAFRSRSSTGSMPELGGEQVHLRLVGEARLHGAEAAHRAARRVVRVHAVASISALATQ